MKIFVTGVSSGIGAALAELLILHGHEVWGVARRGPLMEHLAEKNHSSRFYCGVADVRIKDDLLRVQGLMHESGFLPDARILNAGCYIPDLVHGVYIPEAAETVWQVNLNGVLNTLAVFLPGMCARGVGQCLVVSSLAAFRPDPSSTAYPASKAAVSVVFRSLRLSFANSGILFKTIYLGPVATLALPHYDPQLKTWPVVSALQAAEAITAALETLSEEYYFPGLLSAVYRAMLLIPDRWFELLVRFFRR